MASARRSLTLNQRSPGATAAARAASSAAISRVPGLGSTGACAVSVATPANTLAATAHAARRIARLLVLDLEERRPGLRRLTVADVHAQLVRP